MAAQYLDVHGEVLSSCTSETETFYSSDEELDNELECDLLKANAFIEAESDNVNKTFVFDKVTPPCEIDSFEANAITATCERGELALPVTEKESTVNAPISLLLSLLNKLAEKSAAAI